MSDRDAYIRKAKARIEQWNAEIDKLRAKAREASADGEIAYRDTVQDLCGKRDAFEKRMEEVRHSSDSAWEDLKAGMDTAWNNLSEAMENARSRFG